MRKLLLYSTLALFVLYNLIGCGTRSPRQMFDALPYSPFVEAFTSGTVSRTVPVYIIFSQEIEQQRMESADLSKIMKIKPEVAGDFSFENNKTILFRPKGEFDRNTTYVVSIDLSNFFDVEGREKDFAYKFTTLPISIRGSLESVDMNNDSDTEIAYDVSVSLFTPDTEQPELVQSLVKFSESVNAEWTHSMDGKRHNLLMTKIKAAEGGARALNISVQSNKLGVPTENLLAVQIPGKRDFELYSVVYHSEPERFIEVTFSQKLDQKQEMHGLAFILNNKSERVTVSGNKLRLYPDSGQVGKLTVALDAAIKSSAGMTLKEEITREVEISSKTPAIRFIGEGVIMPQSTQIIVPFQAVYLRGVVVRVIRIMEQNIGQFLQNNRLDGKEELVRVGRIVARKTIFLDDVGQDLTQWGTYAIDLKEIMQPEHGAIYRVELSFTQELSAYPCDEPIAMNREQIAANDEVEFKAEQRKYDMNGSYYYYYWDDDYNWWDYDYNESENPCSSSFYMGTRIGRNVLATNLGLMAKAGESGEMLVMVHSLISTAPENGVNIAVYNYQNQMIASGVTDIRGQLSVQLNPNSRAYYVVATQGKQRSYLRVDDPSSLSLSTFDVSGSVVQRGIKGFIYGDRGVWRPGDTLHMSFMLGDKSNSLPIDHPVVMELYNPLGQLYAKKTQTRSALGLYSFQMTTDAEAPTGAWSVKVVVGGVTFTKLVRVEAIKPNRLKINTTFKEEILLSNRPLEGDIHVEWLQGATARNLKYEIDGVFTPIKTEFPKFKGYVFDDPIKTFSTEEMSIASGVTNAEGDAKLNQTIDVGDYAPGMLQASLNMRVYEESGDFSIDAMRMQFSPYKRYVGVRSPQQDKTRLTTGAKHTYQVASVDYKGVPQEGVTLRVELYKVNWYWWWSSNNNSLANYISNRYDDKFSSFSVTTKANGVGSFDLQFENDQWGTYFINVKDPNGHSTGVMSYFDWPYYEGRRDMEGADAAQLLSFKTDKDSYAPGDKMVVTVPSSEGSRAIITIENGSRVLSTIEQDCSGGETKVQVDITADMQPNAYVYVTMLQPHGVVKNDLPIRLYGVEPISVTSKESRLQPVIVAQDEIRPESKYSIEVSESGGREMAYTLAIVDEGLLDLTRFKTPDPWSVFNAREALGVRSWDMYSYVIGAYGGRIEQLFSIGGDDELEGSGPKAIVNRFKPVVKFEGPFILKRGEKNKHSYDMPNYNGRVRVMVVAGDGRAYGDTEKSIMVRKPLMLLGTLPRVIGTEEEMVVPANVFATQKGVGNVTVSIECSDNMEVMGAKTQTLNFREITDKQAYFRIKVGPKPGAGHVVITAVSSNDKSTYETDIEIRSVRRAQIKTRAEMIPVGKTWSDKMTMHGMNGTNKLTLEISNVEPVNLTERLSFLLGYPHGCMEQITSKGFPQLFLKEFASLTTQQETMAEQAIKETLNRQRSYQIAEGAFAYWPGGTSSHAWATIYGTHFMLEAEAKGYLIHESVKQKVLNNLRLVARNWRAEGGYMAASEQITQGYRLYVLALAKSAELGAMNRLREMSNLNEITRWWLAAAYAKMGRKDVAELLLKQTADQTKYYGQHDYTFGSDLRDKSIKLMTLTLMGDSAQAMPLASEISKTLSTSNWYSTQTTAFALVAMSQYMGEFASSKVMKFTYTYNNGSPKLINTDLKIWSEMLVEAGDKPASLSVENRGEGALFIRVTTEGVPEQGEEEPYENGLSLEYRYVDAKGESIDVRELEQGTNFTAVVKIKNPTATAYNNVELTQIFPAGWEILNTRFTDEEAGNSYPAGIDYQDIRDDRVYSYIDRLSARREVTVYIHLAAVYSGVFYAPPVYTQAMYDNLIRANTKGEMVTVIRK